jgi:hypothetical protein
MILLLLLFENIVNLGHEFFSKNNNNWKKKIPLNGSKFILFYLVVKVVKSQMKPCSQYEFVFLEIFPQFEVFFKTIFVEETLPDFIKRREHPSKGREGEERNNVQSRREDHQCPTRRWAKMTLPP